MFGWLVSLVYLQRFVTNLSKRNVVTIKDFTLLKSSWAIFFV